MPLWFYFFRKSHKGYPAPAVSKNRLESGKWKQPKPKSNAFLVTCFPLHHDLHLTSKRNSYPFMHVFPQSLLRKHGVTFPIQVDTRSLLMPIMTEGLFSSSISKIFQRIFLRGNASWHYSFYSPVKTGKKLHISVIITKLNPR